MPPNQHNQPPQPTPQPQRSFTPQAPHFDYNSAPHPQQFQQHPNGQYEVVPAPTPNNSRQSGHNPYDFIVNPNTPKRSIGGGMFSGKAPWKGLALIGAGLVVVIIIVGIVLSSLAPKGSTPGLTAAAQRQQEIIRIATAATKTAAGQGTRNFATNVQFSVTSSQEQTLAYLKSHGTKVKKQQLALNKDVQTDALLANALTAGTYDTAVVQNLTSQLQTYEGLLKSTYNQTTGKSARELLQASYDSAAKLLEQAKALNSGNDQ
jgi:type II secretory pathway pseudopilin PulG